MENYLFVSFRIVTGNYIIFLLSFDRSKVRTNQKLSKNNMIQNNVILQKTNCKINSAILFSGSWFTDFFNCSFFLFFFGGGGG